MKVIAGGITRPKGFLACGINCGIKYKNKDLALIYSPFPCVAGGVFTQNKVQAAPVKLSQRHMGNHKAQAIIVNSGNANCCTGKQGLADAGTICTGLAKKLYIGYSDILIASTGIIGKRLPAKKIVLALDLAVNKLARNSDLACAQAIITTDTKPKQIAVQLLIGKKTVTIGAMAKGAGMIHPNLATMLGFITTDLAIDKKRLQSALKQAVDNSFNLITVEGDTSTNDMVLILANGLAGNKRLNTREFKLFQKGLNFVCLKLAKMIIHDAEGASKFVQIQVTGTQTVAQAKRVAFKVANSPLVKTAIFGSNPNWGRIAAAVGSADSAVQAAKLAIYLGPVKVVAKGAALKVRQSKLNQIFAQKEISINIVLGTAKAAARVYTCDLSDKYVKINAEY